MAKTAKPPTVGDERPRSSKPKRPRDAGSEPVRSSDKPDGDGETAGMPVGLVLLFVVPLLALLAWGFFMN